VEAATGARPCQSAHHTALCTREAQSTHGDHHAGAVREAGRRTHHHPLPKDGGEERRWGNCGASREGFHKASAKPLVSPVVPRGIRTPVAAVKGRMDGVSHSANRCELLVFLAHRCRYILTDEQGAVTTSSPSSHRCRRCGPSLRAPSEQSCLRTQMSPGGFPMRVRIVGSGQRSHYTMREATPR
jgi:hypothetical protein